MAGPEGRERRKVSGTGPIVTAGSPVKQSSSGGKSPRSLSPSMSGPNRVADKIRDDLDDIAAELDGGALPQSRRSELNKRAHRLKSLLQWCETRAGYVA